MNRKNNLNRAFSRFPALARAVMVIGVLFPACNKNGGTPGGGTPNNSDVLYPATLSFYEGNNSAYPAKSIFKYDDKHRLTYMGNDSRYSNISGSGVQQVVINNGDILSVANLFAGDIYTGQAVNLVKTNYMWKYSTGSSLTGPVSTYYFGVDETNNLLANYNAGTYTQHFTYDKDGNLSFSKIVTNAAGSPGSGNYNPGGLEYDRLTFTGYDNKPSPYSAVAGYRFIAYQWAYPQEFYFAMSKHNPTKIIEESLNTTTMKWSVYSQTDLTYTYNKEGYPSQVKIKTVYPSTATPNQAFYQTYDFTYAN